MLNRSNIVLLLTITLLSICLNSIGATDNEIVEILSFEKDIDVISNKINNVDWSQKNLVTLKNLWAQEYKKYPSISEAKLQNTLVRLSIANVLMQAKRQCRIDIEMSKLRQYVLMQTKSSSIRVKSRATYFLGLAGNNEDIPYLSSVVTSEEEGFAEEAVLSLTFIHTPEALNALEKLSNKVKRVSLKEFIFDFVSKYNNTPLVVKSKNCT